MIQSARLKLSDRPAHFAQFALRRIFVTKSQKTKPQKPCEPFHQSTPHNRWIPHGPQLLLLLKNRHKRWSLRIRCKCSHRTNPQNRESTDPSQPIRRTDARTGLFGNTHTTLVIPPTHTTGVFGIHPLPCGPFSGLLAWFSLRHLILFNPTMQAGRVKPSNRKPGGIPKINYAVTDIIITTRATPQPLVLQSMQIV